MPPLDALRSALLRRARRRMPAPLPDEVPLFEAAEALLAGGAVELTAPALRRATQAHGLDVATALFAAAARQQHAAFGARVDAPRPVSGSRPNARLVVVPALQHATLPGFGGDGAIVRRVAAALGIPSEVVPTTDRDSADACADRLREALERPAEGDGAAAPVWLVSLSKGAVDVRRFFERHADAAGGVAAWVAVCGFPLGTPLVATLSARRRWLLRHVLGLSPRVYDDYGPNPAPFAPPAHVRTVSLVACPTPAHMTTGSGRAQQATLAATHGPSDGMVPLAEAVVPGSDVLPVWGADHFFRVPTPGRLFRGVLADLAASSVPDAAPTPR